MVDREAAYRGSARIVTFAVRRNGRSPGKEFFESLTDGEQAKVMALFKKIGDTGKIHNREKFKHIADGLFEFKSFQIRMICFHRSDGEIVVTHGFRKKSQRTNKNEIAKALDIKNEFESAYPNIRQTRTGGLA